MEMTKPRWLRLWEAAYIFGGWGGGAGATDLEVLSSGRQAVPVHVADVFQAARLARVLRLLRLLRLVKLVKYVMHWYCGTSAARVTVMGSALGMSLAHLPPTPIPGAARGAHVHSPKHGDGAASCVEGRPDARMVTPQACSAATKCATVRVTLSRLSSFSRLRDWLEDVQWLSTGTASILKLFAGAAVIINLLAGAWCVLVMPLLCVSGHCGPLIVCTYA
jgi:hypothetical protein